MINRYVEALPPNYRATIRGKTTLEAAMEEARVIDADLRAQMNDGGNKRKNDVPPSSNPKKKQIDSKKNFDPFCQSCHNRHSGTCTKETMKCRHCGQKGHSHIGCTNEPICYNCKESGHISRSCPKVKTPEGNKIDIPKAKSRAFQMTVEE